MLMSRWSGSWASDMVQTFACAAGGGGGSDGGEAGLRRMPLADFPEAIRHAARFVEQADWRAETRPNAHHAHLNAGAPGPPLSVL